MLTPETHSSLEFSYQPLNQSDLHEGLPQMASRGLLPLLPLHRSSNPTTNGTCGCSESSFYPAIEQLANPGEDHIQLPVHTPISTHAGTCVAVSSQQELRKGRPPGLVFLPHESNFTRLDVTLGRFNPYPSQPMDEAMVSSSPYQVYIPGSGHGKEIARKMFSTEDA
jgi:hypothetical protein